MYNMTRLFENNLIILIAMTRNFSFHSQLGRIWIKTSKQASSMDACMALMEGTIPSSLQRPPGIQ